MRDRRSRPGLTPLSCAFLALVLAAPITRGAGRERAREEAARRPPPSGPVRRGGEPTPRDITTAPDAKARILWARPDGQAILKRMSQGGVTEASWTFGPFAGWQAVALSFGSDSRYRLLWSDGQGNAVLSTIDDNGTVVDGDLYGTFPGWNAVDIACGPQGWTRILWTNPTAGGAVVWFVDPPGLPGGYLDLRSIPLPWLAQRISVDGQGGTRVQWSDTSSGQVAMWNLALDGTVGPYALYGPYAGYRGLDIGASRTLSPSSTWFIWGRTDGALAVWTLDPSLGVVGSRLHGPFPGYTAVSVAADPEGRGLVLWSGPNGLAVAWRVLPDTAISDIWVVAP